MDKSHVFVGDISELMKSPSFFPASAAALSLQHSHALYRFS
jgi:hypothetical protein